MKKTIKTALAMLLVVCMALPMFVMPISAELIEGSVPKSKITWTYETTTNVVTVTSTGAGYIMTDPRDAEGGWGVGRYAEIREVVFKNGSGGTFKIMSSEIFKHTPAMTALTKVTIPATVTAMYDNTFTGATSFKELVVEGNAYIPGAVDLSNITTAVLSANNHRMFENTAIETIILKGGVYSAENPLQDEYTASGYCANKYSMGKLTTIMGPYNDPYLEDFAKDNNYNYIPYGKIGTGTAWTYDEATNTVTIYGNGTSSTLTAISEDGAAYPAETTNVIIRSDIASIEENALASLANLENVVFEGDVPAAEADPFGGKTVALHKSHTAATPSEGYWAGQSIKNYSGEYDGSFDANNLPDQSSTWEYDVVTKTLTISNTSTKGRVNTKAGYDINSQNYLLWGVDYGTQIEHIVITGNIERIAENAFYNHTALKSVVLPSKAVDGISTDQQIHQRAFAGCTNLTTISLSGHASIPGVADLSEGSTATGSYSIQIFTNDGWNSTFMNTAIKGIIVPYNAPLLYADNLPSKLENVIFRYDDTTGVKNNKQFFENDTYNLMYYGKMEDNKITWLYDPDAKALSIYGTGALTSLSLPEVVTDVDSLYIDNGITSIDAATFETLGSFGIDGVDNSDKAGVAVRYEGYNGLRNIYDFNNGVSDVLENFGYSLVEFGAILVSSNKLAASGLTEDGLVVDPMTLKTNVDDAVKKDVWSNGAWTGKVLSYAEGVETTFAVTLTNYTNNWDSGVYSRAYAVYEDASGNRTVVYADNGGAVSLYDAMVSGCQQGVLAGKVCEDVAVWNVLETGKVADLTVTGATAMVINGKDASADTKVLVVRGADGTVADEATIAAAKTAAEAKGYTVDSKVIALAFTSAT